MSLPFGVQHPSNHFISRYFTRPESDNIEGSLNFLNSNTHYYDVPRSVLNHYLSFYDPARCFVLTRHTTWSDVVTEVPILTSKLDLCYRYIEGGDDDKFKELCVLKDDVIILGRRRFALSYFNKPMDIVIASEGSITKPKYPEEMTEWCFFWFDYKDPTSNCIGRFIQPNHSQAKEEVINSFEVYVNEIGIRWTKDKLDPYLEIPIDRLVNDIQF